MHQPIGLLGVPSSAGAQTPGIDKAPAAVRAAGLVAALQQAGRDVHDFGDMPRTRYTPDKAHPTAQNLGRVVAVATELAAHVGALLDARAFPVVLGGDCSITVGLVAAFVQRDPSVRLLYVDGGLDLFTPPTKLEGTGHLDSMGVAHLLGAAGAADELSQIGNCAPLLAPEQVVYYGCEHKAPDDPEEVAFKHFALRSHPAATIRGRAPAAAAAVVAQLEAQPGPFLIHFDVDVIDFLDFPLADVPLYNAGLAFDEAMDSLATFVASPQCAGLVITELNPDHMDEDGVGVRHFVDALVRVLG